MTDSALSLKYMTPAEMGKYWDEMDAQLPDLMKAAREAPGTKAP
jgi:hypothetical protein